MTHERQRERERESKVSSQKAPPRDLDFAWVPLVEKKVTIKKPDFFFL